MLGFIGSRLLQAIPVLLVVGLIAYALFDYVGDPVSILLGQDHTEAQRVELVKQLGLDQPFFVHYGRFLWTALHGNFGISYRLAQPVSSLIADRLPATLELAISASVLAFAIGVPMGVYTGIHRETLLSACQRALPGRKTGTRSRGQRSGGLPRGRGRTRWLKTIKEVPRCVPWLAPG